MPGKTVRGMVTVEGQWVPGEDLRAGDQFRALGPVQTIKPDSPTGKHQILYTNEGDYHWSSGATDNNQKQFILIKKAPRRPEHYPPQNGDLWRHADGHEYYVTGDRVMVPTGASMSKVSFCNDLSQDGENYTLIHRKGNAAKSLLRNL